jgi:DNA-binding transcriptional MerR regulator
MARKAYWQTRRPRKRTRPKSSAPQGGFLIVDVARLTGVPVRTLRDYVRRGLLRYTEVRGTLTRYPTREVARLVAALRLRAEKRGTWAAIKAELDTFDDARLQSWLAEQRLAPALATELGISGAPNGEATGVALPQSSSMGTGERWERTELLPGLELALSDAASPAVRSAARRIIEEHARRP